MHCIVIDAHILACPVASDYMDKAEFTKAFETYLETLSSWTTIKEKFRLITNNDIEQVLHSTGSYPFWESVNDALTSLGLDDDYEARDIIKLLDTFLNKSDVLEEILEVEEVLCVTSKVEPAGSLGHRSDEFLQHFDRLIGLLSLDKILDRKLNSSPILLSKCNKSSAKPLTITGTLEDFDGKEERGLAVPIDFINEMQTAHLPNEAMRHFDYISVWKEKSVMACQTAVEIYLLKIRNICYDKLDDFRANWKVNPSLLESLAGLDLFYDATKVEKIIRSISETILRENLMKTHGLRDGEGGNNSTITKGKSKAMRRDIDDEFHLHYWDDGSNIRISNVVVHNDFKIY